MPVCKNCKSRIDKFSKDRCPICGVENPFDGMNSETIEVTTSVDVEDRKNYHPRKKKTALILFILLGFFGVPFFYLHEYKKGSLYCALNLLAIGVMTFVFGFYVEIPYLYSALIGVAIMLIINTVFGIIFYLKPNMKDGRGEFII